MVAVAEVLKKLDHLASKAKSA